MEEEVKLNRLLKIEDEYRCAQAIDRMYDRGWCTNHQGNVLEIMSRVIGHNLGLQRAEIVRTWEQQAADGATINDVFSEAFDIANLYAMDSQSFGVFQRAEPGYEFDVRRATSADIRMRLRIAAERERLGSSLA